MSILDLKNASHSCVCFAICFSINVPFLDSELQNMILENISHLYAHRNKLFIKFNLPFQKWMAYIMEINDLLYSASKEYC